NERVGRSTLIRGGTAWRYIGSLPEGAVYKPVDTVFTVRAFQNVHEAYLVLQDGMLAGYYLPPMRSLSIVGNPVRIEVTAPEERGRQHETHLHLPADPGHRGTRGLRERPELQGGERRVRAARGRQGKDLFLSHRGGRRGGPAGDLSERHPGGQRHAEGLLLRRS